MKHLLLALALSLTGCLFGGGSSSSTDEDTGSAGPDMGGATLDTGGDPTPDVSGIDADQVDPDVGVPPDGWHAPELDKRVGVSWDITTDPMPFVVPLDIAAFGAPEEAAFFDAESGSRLDAEVDGPTAWVLIPEFGRPTKLFMYYGGPALPETSSPWDDDYAGVWHLSPPNIRRDSAGGNELEGAEASVEGIVGGSAAINDGVAGATGALSVPTLNATFFPQDAATVEFWFRLTEPDSTQTLINALFGGAGRNASIIAAFGGGMGDEISFGYSTDGVNPVRNNFLFSPRGWHYLAFTWDGDSIRAYFDGSFQRDVMPPAGWTPSGQEAVFGGAWNGNGVLDEVRISRVRRSDAYLSTVNAVYRQGGFGEFGEVEDR